MYTSLDHKLLIPFLYKKELQKSKKILNYNFSKQDIIYESTGQVNLILNNGESFNDLILIVKLNSNDKIELHKLINYVEFLIGGQPYDKVSGVFLNVLLKHYKLHSTQTENIFIIPIPFPLILKDSVVFSCKSSSHDKRLKVVFNIPIESYELRVTHYTHLPTQLLEVNDSNFKNLIYQNLLGQVYKNFQYDTFNFINNQPIALNFNLFSSHMFIVFADQDNNIMKNKTFTNLKIALNGQDTIISTYELLKYDTIKQYGKFEGYYYINLENFPYGVSHLFDTMINFSLIDSVRLKITSTEQFVNSNLKVHVGVISYNCLYYADNKVGYLYPN